MKNLNYRVQLLVSLLFSFTAGTIMLNTMKEVSPMVFNFSNLFSLFAGILCLQYLKNNNNRKKALRYFKLFIMVDVIMFAMISYISLTDLVVRYILIVVVYPLVSEVMMTLTEDIQHRHMDGDELTQFRATLRQNKTMGSAIGFAVALILSNTDFYPGIREAVLLQMIAVLLESYVSFKWNETDKKELKLAVEVN